MAERIHATAYRFSDDPDSWSDALLDVYGPQGDPGPEFDVQGLDPEKLELDWKKLRDEQEDGARRSVHARLVLDAVARAEGLEVSAAEVQQRIRSDAQAIGETYETLRKRLEERGGAEVVHSQMLREKSLDLLTTVANIQNEE